jgi:prolyl-tRNA editing enzyme YbaK/EbsC (Cys-tRNA(Pro) deacylase)
MPRIDEVKRFLDAHNIVVREFEQPTPSSEAAARAVGCSVAEIAKTVLFLVGSHPVVVVTSGDMKVKASELKRTLGLRGKVRLPESHEVIEITGYAPGGVCPFLLPADLEILVDSSMRRFPLVYAAAGNEHSAVPISVDQLLAITNGTEVAVCGMAHASGNL